MSLGEPTKMSAIECESEEKHKGEYTTAIGETGTWQILLFVMTAVPVRLVQASIQFGIVFMAPKATYRCVARENSTEELVNMTCYDDCTKYEHYSEFESTIVEQWGLICDRAWIADFAQTICMFGILVGSAVFGLLSDRYGRRLTLMIAGMLELSTSFTMPFCSDLWSFIVVRFFLGAAGGGAMMISFVFLMEIFGSSKRNLLGTFFMVPISFGYMVMATIAFYCRTWRSLSIGMALPSLVFVIYFFYLPESPKWLISVGKLEEASSVMISAAERNKLPTNDIKAIVEKIAKEGDSDKRSKRQATFKDLVMLPSLRKTNLCSCLIWFSCGLSYFGVTQYFGQTSTNTFLSFTLIALFQIPGFLLSGYASNVFGKRVTASIFFIISSIGNGILALPEEWYYVKLVAGTVGVSSGAAVFSVIYVFTAELFPTVARNMGIGASSAANRIGSMLAPFVAGLRTQITWLPPVVFAVMPIVGVAACWCLPETKGKKLEDHLEED